jgi:hypothetical protein
MTGAAGTGRADQADGVSRRAQLEREQCEQDARGIRADEIEESQRQREAYRHCSTLKKLSHR